MKLEGSDVLQSGVWPDIITIGGNFPSSTSPLKGVYGVLHRGILWILHCCWRVSVHFWRANTNFPLPSLSFSSTKTGVWGRYPQKFCIILHCCGFGRVLVHFQTKTNCPSPETGVWGITPGEKFYFSRLQSSIICKPQLQPSRWLLWYLNIWALDHGWRLRAALWQRLNLVI